MQAEGRGQRAEGGRRKAEAEDRATTSKGGARLRQRSAARVEVEVEVEIELWGDTVIGAVPWCLRHASGNLHRVRVQVCRRTASM
jgi:hypothetical protein